MTDIPPQHQPASEHKPAAPVGDAVKTNPDPSSEGRDERHHRDRDVVDWIRLGMEVVGFFVLIAGFCVAYRSLDELHTQTSALTVQTDAISQQVYAGERAYLLVKNVRLGSPGDLAVGKDLQLKWDAVNVGQTPATNLVTFYAFYIGPPAVPDPPQQGIIRGYSEHHALGPTDAEPSPDLDGVWVDSRSGRKLSKEELDGIRSGKVRLHVWISVRYDTVFKNIPGNTITRAYWDGSRFSMGPTDVK